MCSSSGKPGAVFCLGESHGWVCLLGNPAQELTMNVNCSTCFSKQALSIPELWSIHQSEQTTNSVAVITALSSGTRPDVCAWSWGPAFHSAGFFSRSLCNWWRAVIMVLLFCKSSLLFNFFQYEFRILLNTSHVFRSGTYSYRPFHSNMWKTSCAKVKKKGFSLGNSLVYWTIF